jgi:Ser/Thr protein kinase RdoA (MazF antagonist)
MHELSSREPTAEDAAGIVTAWSGMDVASAERFPTGLANFVYDVTTRDGGRVVARLQRQGEGTAFEGAISWSRTLRPKGVPLPELYAYDLTPEDGRFPFMLLERLPGRDLEHDYPALSDDQKRRLAGRIIDIQHAVGELPYGRGFGYGASFDDPELHPTWRDLLLASLRRSRERIVAAGVLSTDWVDRVAERLPALDGYFSTIEPVPFLDDTTVKNVIVHDGELSGIVDVDWVCFGDPLFTVALTRMALLARCFDTDYIDFWTADLDLSVEQQAALSFYTALFCVDFMSELGHSFNQEAPVAADSTAVEHLAETLSQLLS